MRFAADAARWGARVRPVPPLQRVYGGEELGMQKIRPKANRIRSTRKHDLSIHAKGLQDADAGGPQYDPVRPPCSERRDQKAIDTRRSQQAGEYKRVVLLYENVRPPSHGP